jgi:hypothetical protein
MLEPLSIGKPRDIAGPGAAAPDAVIRHRKVARRPIVQMGRGPCQRGPDTIVTPDVAGR